MAITLATVPIPYPQTFSAKQRTNDNMAISINNVTFKDIIGSKKFVYELGYEMLTDAEYQTLEGIYDTHIAGSTVAFVFSEQGVNKTCQMEMSEREIIPGTNQLSNVRIQLTEV